MVENGEIKWALAKAKLGAGAGLGMAAPVPGSSGAMLGAPATAAEGHRS
jgi:hypothetical protein